MKKVLRKIWWWLTGYCFECGLKKVSYGYMSGVSVCPAHGLMLLPKELPEKLSLEQRVAVLEEASAEAERRRSHRMELRRWGV